MPNYLRQFIVAVLILFLGFYANYLKNSKASNYSNINYTKELILIEDVEIITFNLFNQSDYAIDSILINPDFENLLDVKYDSEKSQNKTPENSKDNKKKQQIDNKWQSNFFKSDKIRCLIILSNTTGIETNINPESFIVAIRKNPENLEWINVGLNKGTIPVNVLFYKTFWLSIPFVVVGGFFFLFEFLRKKYGNSGGNTTGGSTTGGNTSGG